MKDRKTMVILSPGFPASEDDTTSVTFPQIFVKNLKMLNPSLNIIVLAFQYPFHNTHYEWHGVKVYPFNGKNKGKLYRLWVWKNVWQKVKSIVKENEAIGMLSFWLGECAFIAKHAARKYGIKNFTWLLGQDARKGNRYVKWIRPMEGSLIALSDAISDELNKNYNIRPAHTIPLGIDTSLFSSETMDRTIDIMGAGSLIALKRYDIFVSVVTQLVKVNPALKTVICGEGAEKAKLQKMITENNLAKNIELRGEVPHHQVLSLMQSARVFLHPSSYEGFSTVCAEALYAGAHVVAFCKPMNNEFAHFHNVERQEDLVPFIKNLLEDQYLNHRPVLTCPIEQVCREVMSLYEWK